MKVERDEGNMCLRNPRDIQIHQKRKERKDRKGEENKRDL